MARIESIAVGGYYPTPLSVIPHIAAMIDKGTCPSFLDPCAGDGEAVMALVRELGVEKARLYAVELEKTRHDALEQGASRRFGWSRSDVLHGDAFRAVFEGDGVGLLYLNPPYDLDPEHGRLEEKFLERFTDALASKGVLVFLVPFYALKASAKTLATHYEGLQCFRFPDEDFGAYKQVALLATKRETALWEPDPDLEKTVLGWSELGEGLPVLGASCEKFPIPSVDEYEKPFSRWEMSTLDMKGLLASTSPWCQTDRGGKKSRVPGIMPEGALEDLLVRRYPLAMPPRPAHIAAGIASGIFNGARLSPDDVNSTLPDILVKGVFDKEFRTVDEKKDKDGNVKAVVQVQQPKLVTTLLDLSTSKYVTVKSSAERTKADDVESFTMADLLATYGRGLMQTMLRQCPVMHEPSRDAEAFALPELARPLFHAQKHAVMAAVKLLGGPGKARRGKSAFVLGEIGSGKTSVALATARAVESKRALVMCPPHLLTSWQDQIKAVTPWVRAVVLNDVSDVQRLAADEDPRPLVAILSRETSKLGHAYEAVERCGECGAEAPAGVDHAKKRSLCESRRVLPKGHLGSLVQALATDLLRVFPEDVRVRQVVPSRFVRAAERWASQKKGDTSWESREWSRLVERGNLDRLLDILLERAPSDVTSLSCLESILWADPVPEVLLGVARALYAKAPEESWSTPEVVTTARRLLLVTPDVNVEEFRAIDPKRPSSAYSYGSTDPWKEWEAVRGSLVDGEGAPSWNQWNVRNREGKVVHDKDVLGDRRLVLNVFALLARDSLRLSEACGAPLYQAVPEPRRFPLATFITKRCPNLFDLLILDEGHEYATDGSAQERSAHRLTSLGIPTLLLTGSVMNGYAESLFTNMWALSEDFRREFSRDDRMRFIDRYGYRKRLVEDRDKDSGKVVEYGSMSDRVEKSERMIGEAPGVLPVFLLRYLLPLAVTLHKTDLAIDIPKCSESKELVAPETQQARNFKGLETKLLAQIKEDRFSERSGQLWGALAEMPSYLDMAVTGNTDDGRYVIAYPEGEIVASVDAMPESTVLPKETWLLKHLEKAFAEGRNVLVFVWHTRLLPRLARLIERDLGEKPVILDPSKVKTKDRETWINKEVIGKKRRVLLCNPITVQTGLNNLVYFADEIWFENPACNPVVYRQAVGRVDRIGQKLPTRILFPLYEGTPQDALYSLLLQKVAVSMSADGLDGESTMQAAGIGEEGFSSFSVGRQLYDLLTKQD
jgi:hypothetical protein